MFYRTTLPAPGIGSNVRVTGNDELAMTERKQSSSDRGITLPGRIKENAEYFGQYSRCFYRRLNQIPPESSQKH